MTIEHGYLKTLFLHPPSYEGFDGGAGARYQARREIRSFWYPTWLAQPAALVPGSRLVDAPPDDLTLDDVRPMAADYDLAILHTSTPSFAHDVRVAEALKAENPALRVGLVGAHVAVNPVRALSASRAIDFVARNEFDFTIKEVAEDRPLETVLGLSFRSNGTIRHTPDRPVLEDMDTLPFVVDVYKRDLVVEHYAIGYLLHPYVSLYTGRGCRSKCTFCLWPQTVGGHRYRTRSVEHVADEIALATRHFPQVREYFFDDDTLTDDLPRVEALARRLGKLGVTWSCNAKANVPYESLKVMKDNGLRLLLVGYESGNQTILNNVKKGIRLDMARLFTRHAKTLGIKIHGTFILGLPGEAADTIQESIRFACDINPDTIQVSIAAPYPGTELFRQAVDNGWLSREALVDERGAQVSPVVSAPRQHRDRAQHRGVLPPILLPAGEALRHRAGDGGGPPGHAAAAPRGPRIPAVPRRPHAGRARPGHAGAAGPAGPAPGAPGLGAGAARRGGGGLRRRRRAGRQRRCHAGGRQPRRLLYRIRGVAGILAAAARRHPGALAARRVRRVRGGPGRRARSQLARARDRSGHGAGA